MWRTPFTFEMCFKFSAQSVITCIMFNCIWLRGNAEQWTSKRVEVKTTQFPVTKLCKTRLCSHSTVQERQSSCSQRSCTSAELVFTVSRLVDRENLLFQCSHFQSVLGRRTLLGKFSGHEFVRWSHCYARNILEIFKRGLNNSSDSLRQSFSQEILKIRSSVKARCPLMLPLVIGLWLNWF